MSLFLFLASIAEKNAGQTFLCKFLRERVPIVKFASGRTENIRPSVINKKLAEKAQPKRGQSWTWKGCRRKTRERESLLRPAFHSEKLRLNIVCLRVMTSLPASDHDRIFGIGNCSNNRFQVQLSFLTETGNVWSVFANIHISGLIPGVSVFLFSPLYSGFAAFELQGGAYAYEAWLNSPGPFHAHLLSYFFTLISKSQSSRAGRTDVATADISPVLLHFDSTSREGAGTV